MSALPDDGEARFLPRFSQNLQALDAETLEGIRGRARFVGAATEDAGARGCHRLGRLEHLPLGLDGAGAGHDNKLAAADLGVADLDQGGGAVRRPGNQVKARELAVPLGDHSAPSSSLGPAIWPLGDVNHTVR